MGDSVVQIILGGIKHSENTRFLDLSHNEIIFICKHLNRNVILKEVFSIFKKCCMPGEIWGLRKLCLQLAPELIAFLDDTEALKFILDFLKMSLLRPNDQSAEEEDA